MPVRPSRVPTSRLGWLVWAFVVAILFAIANLTAQSSAHPGTVSNIVFIAFAALLVLGLALGVAMVIRRCRAAQ